MSSSSKSNAIEGSLIQSVVLVDRVTRDQLGPFQSTSLPGHLLHLVTEGEVEQTVSGRVQRLTPGTAVWYYENEAVQGTILKKPWTFYTVNFLASRLSPPPFEKRVWNVPPRAACLFQSLLEAWDDQSGPSMVRHLRTFTRLMELLLEVLPEEVYQHRADLATNLWWEIETRLREDLSRPVDLATLQAMSGRSQRSIIRACQMAVSASPMKRIKELRLSYARGLVLYSQMPMTEIALRVGYGRVQELSRDYHRRFGVTPRDDRLAGPDYRQPPKVQEAFEEEGK